MKHLVPLLSGVLFSVGLVISGMTNTETVTGFLDITNNWRPDLLFVMIGAISTHSLSYILKKSMSNPLLEINWNVPQSKILDVPLLLGAIIFGVGWGIAGVCPGPAIVGFAGKPSATTFVFFASMIVGILLFRFTKSKLPIK